MAKSRNCHRCRSGPGDDARLHPGEPHHRRARRPGKDKRKRLHLAVGKLIRRFGAASRCGQRWIRTTEGERQQIYSLPHLATLVFAPTLQKELFSLLNHRRVNFTRTISVLISSPPREERLIPLILERASCRIRTNDPEITNHVLWPTELKRQAKKCNRNVHSVSETAANLGIYFLPAKF